MARVARRSARTRARVALLYGRRYEGFGTRAAWHAFAAKWRETLPRMRPESIDSGCEVGIENHKDWLAAELVALIRAVDSPYVGACVDFGNNSRLLEDPDETMRPAGAVRGDDAPQGHGGAENEYGVRAVGGSARAGHLPLVATSRPFARAPRRPALLEMITRDPLSVPYKTDRYWVGFTAARTRAAAALRGARARRAWAAPLPRSPG